MGEIHRGEDLRLRCEIAIKVPPELVASSTGRLAWIARQARWVAACAWSDHHAKADV